MNFPESSKLLEEDLYVELTQVVSEQLMFFLILVRDGCGLWFSLPQERLRLETGKS